MNTLNELLEDSGLNEAEGKIYLAALELGTASASEIALKAGVQRTYFYDIAKRLAKMGYLKQVVRGKKTLFHVIDPEELVALQVERARKFENVLPELKALHNTARGRPKIFFYEGLKGLERINDDTLSQKGEIVGFTTPMFVSKEQKRISDRYISERKARGTRARVIGEMSSEVLELKRRDTEELRETRILPSNLFSSAVEIGVYGNKVFMVDYRQEFGFIIEGAEFSKTMKQIFELVWDTGKVVRQDR